MSEERKDLNDIEDAVSTAFFADGIFRTYAPSTSVTVPTDEAPSSMTAAPMTGSPLLSFIVPLTVTLLCANTLAETRRNPVIKHARNSDIIFFMVIRD